MGSTGGLSPYSGSQGNMSITSPMSTSSSPMHVTDNYINLTNASGIYFKSACLRYLIILLKENISNFFSY